MNVFYIGGHQVEKGDRIILETGEVLVFKSFLGSGDNTIVFEDSMGRGVRIPKNMQVDMISDYMFQGFISTMKLINSAVPKSLSVEIQEHDLKSKYVSFVEKLDIEIDVLDFLDDSGLDRGSEKYLELLIFLDEFRVFSYINDFLPFQIGWEKGRGWVLYDVGSYASLNSDKKKTTPVRNLLKYWDDDIDRAMIQRLVEDVEKFVIKSKPFSCSSLLL